MGDRKGTKGLELWCRKITEGYPNVRVNNMTTSWRDGMAFCAIIHHFRPELIDFSKLNKDDIYYNNELAFRIAERHLGIPALLEPEDMVDYPVPDRLSILTYLSQFYQAFAAVSRGTTSNRITGNKRLQPSTLTTSSTDHNSIAVSSTSPNPPTKIGIQGGSKVRKESCANCALPVFIAERLNVGKYLYHRTCFRCARCNSQLTLANYYETENNEYCCELCPDEELSRDDNEKISGNPMSDEEKSLVKKQDSDDIYSENFEKFVENTDDSSLTRRFTLKENLKEFASFIDSQMDIPDEKPPDLPKSKPPLTDDINNFPTFIISNKISNNDDVHISSNESSNSIILQSNDSLDHSVTKDMTTITTSTSSNSITRDVVEKNDDNLVKNRIKLYESIKTDKSDDCTNENIEVDLEKKSIIPEILVENDEVMNEKIDEYPEDLNPFGDDEETPNTIKQSLNPFEDEDEEMPSKPESSPKPALRKKKLQLKNYNPFDEDEIEADKNQPSNTNDYNSSLNPFGSDEDEDEAELKTNTEETPVPKPRMFRSNATTPEPVPREKKLITITTPGSRKKLAPKPPPTDEFNLESEPNSMTSSPSPSVTHSPHSRMRKARRAPPPPTTVQPPPLTTVQLPPLTIKQPPPLTIVQPSPPTTSQPPPPETFTPNVEGARATKLLKNESNLNKQMGPNKSTYGKWKRRKGPAPTRPIPQRRIIKILPMINELKNELDTIEIQQQGLEKQGVRLEQMIREKCEGPDNMDNPDDSIAPEVEELILQLFELVNEKNELFRKQAELMYLRRQQRLEEEHADVEYQIRCLMLESEANKTDTDKAKEEELIARLVDIVERRNEIIECLEMDRLREAEEDDSIQNQMNLYTLKMEKDDNEQHTQKKKLRKFKLKMKIGNHSSKIDADKDVDESCGEMVKKDKKKKKFVVF